MKHQLPVGGMCTIRLLPIPLSKLGTRKESETYWKCGCLGPLDLTNLTNLTPSLLVLLAMMSTTAIHLIDVNAVLTTPTSLLPTIQDPSTNRLADHLGSLYIEGNTNCDSYDVGLSNSISPLGMPAFNQPSSPRERNQLRKEKTVGLTR